MQIAYMVKATDVRGNGQHSPTERKLSFKAHFEPALSASYAGRIHGEMNEVQSNEQLFVKAAQVVAPRPISSRWLHACMRVAYIVR
jgi:hypothetical protein